MINIFVFIIICVFNIHMLKWKKTKKNQIFIPAVSIGRNQTKKKKSNLQLQQPVTIWHVSERGLILAVSNDRNEENDQK